MSDPLWDRAVATMRDLGVTLMAADEADVPDELVREQLAVLRARRESLGTCSMTREANTVLRCLIETLEESLDETIPASP